MNHFENKLFYSPVRVPRAIISIQEKEYTEKSWYGSMVVKKPLRWMIADIPSNEEK